MALESAQYINGLNPANPSGADRLHQGDDHIRMVKQALKATFPKLTGPITLTQDEINAAPGQVPIGVVCIWYGSSTSIPTGWGLCDGRTYTRTDGAGQIVSPNLVNRIPIGAGTLVDPGEAVGTHQYSVTTGSAGSHTHTATGGTHSHGGQVGGHALTVEQIPAHKHLNGVVDGADQVFNHGGAEAIPTLGANINSNSGSGNREGNTTSVGGGQAHSHGLTIDQTSHEHTISTEGGHTHAFNLEILPPVLGLHYIMKI